MGSWLLLWAQTLRPGTGHLPEGNNEHSSDLSAQVELSTDPRDQPPDDIP